MNKMKYLVICTIFAIYIVSVWTQDGPTPHCTVDGKKCSDDYKCCSFCCHDKTRKCITAANDSILCLSPENNPELCEGYQCPKGTKCELQVVQCFRPPCRRLRVCVPEK